MLTQERIKEAQNNVKQYLADGLLRKISKLDSNILQILIKNCDDSLETAEFLFNNKRSNLWIIVCSYYSMFYIGNGVLYKQSFKVGDKITHKVTSDALIVYIKDKLKDTLLEDYEKAQEEALEIAGVKAEELIESFDYERIKRSRFQYGMTEQAIASKALTSLQRAKTFVFEMKKLL